MHAIIVGIGGVGGYFGGKLALKYAASPGHAVSFVARGAHLEKIRAEGLSVRTVEGDFIADPTAATDRPETLGRADLILLAVKGYDLEDAVASLAGNIGEGTILIPLLNGVDNGDKIRSWIGRGTVLDGCVYISSFIEKPGTIHQVGGSCRILFGPVSGPIDPYRALERYFQEAGIAVRLSENILKEIWSKFLFVAPFACVTSRVGQPFGAVVEKEEWCRTVEGMMEELRSLAAVLGVVLPADAVSKSIVMARKLPYSSRSSMQLDFERGRRTELETFAGYVVRKARDKGIPVPLHEEIYAELAKRSAPASDKVNC